MRPGCYGRCKLSMGADRRPRTLRRLPGRVFWRQPWDDEAVWFATHPEVAGFASTGGEVVLNPSLRLSPRQLRSVLLNETVRVILRRRRFICPTFSLSPWQRLRFANYGTKRDQRHTIIARLIAGDPSAGVPSAVQKRLASVVVRIISLEKPFGRTHVVPAILVHRPGQVFCRLLPR
jgi:hypothetical protein